MIYDLVAVRTALRKIVNEAGEDFDYCAERAFADPFADSCYSILLRPDKPPLYCLIGKLASTLGASDDLLLRYHDNDAYDLAHAMRRELNVHFTQAAIDYMLVVQYLQDRGALWGEALRGADSHTYANDTVEDI